MKTRKLVQDIKKVIKVVEGGYIIDMKTLIIIFFHVL